MARFTLLTFFLLGATSFVAAVTAVIKPVVGNYTYLGCYTEATSGRALSALSYYDYIAMTLEECAAVCSGYTYFGVEYHGECYCGNALAAGSTITPASECSLSCPGDATEFCGAGNRLDMYKLTPVVSGSNMGTKPTTTSTSSSKATSTSTSHKITSTTSTSHTTSASTLRTTTSSAKTSSSSSSTKKSSSSSSSTKSSSSSTPLPTSYWLEKIAHQGKSSFNTDTTYKVFRNVKDFGAKGDGVTDDTAAIQNAMSSGGRCGPGSCTSSTKTPAIVYFPAGTYILSSSIIDYYFTQIIGDPLHMPVLKATSGFSGFGLIDGDQYGANGLGFGATNVFYRQIRNVIFDITAIPITSNSYALHWPSSQATSLQNCVFKMSDAPGTQHAGIFIEGGSGGLMTDLVFYGGLDGVVFGNQQYTTRNLTFYNAVTAISQLWSWGWTYEAISINNCTTGINIAGGGTSGQAVGSINVVDSSFTNTKVAILTAHNANSFPPTGGSLVLETATLTNTPIAIQGPSGTVLAGGTTVIGGWAEGHEYTPSGPTNAQGTLAFSRPAALTVNGKFYARSKPQYETSPLSQFVSVRTAGAKGDGKTDDTHAINTILAAAAANGSIVFFDAGTYKVSSTILIPVGSRVVGESYPVILGGGTFFGASDNPKPVVQVANYGQTGVVEWSDMVVSTQGANPGAILIQWNLASSGTLGGMWDVHTRIGGFAGSNLQLSQCPKTPSSSVINTNCIAAFMSIYIWGSGLYLENCWFWVADHDLDDPNQTQITVYAGRGVYSIASTTWLYGTASEHHDLYQYQFVNSNNVYAGFLQTETAYWQPNPAAGVVTTPLSGWNDPTFDDCASVSGNCKMGWGLRLLNSKNILIYGAGLYSFFDNYDLTCSNSVTAPGNGGMCQSRIFSIEGTSSAVSVYNLNTVGSTQMVTVSGKSAATFSDNVNVYPDTIAVFRTS